MVLTVTPAQCPPHGRGLCGVLNMESQARAGACSVKDWVYRGFSERVRSENECVQEWR